MILRGIVVRYILGIEGIVTETVENCGLYCRFCYESEGFKGSDHVCSCAKSSTSKIFGSDS